MKYAFIEVNRRIWPIRVQYRVLRVSVAGTTSISAAAGTWRAVVI